MAHLAVQSAELEGEWRSTAARVLSKLQAAYADGEDLSVGGTVATGSAGGASATVHAATSAEVEGALEAAWADLPKLLGSSPGAGIWPNVLKEYYLLRFCLKLAGEYASVRAAVGPTAAEADVMMLTLCYAAKRTVNLSDYPSTQARVAPSRRRPTRSPPSR